jgi:dihydroxyacetone kinase-like predicted kinase
MEQRFSPEVLSLLVGGTGESPSPTIDLKTCKAKTSIDGALWGELLRAGFAFLVQHKAECNRINVFPVPDGDTGTNMCLAVQGGVKSYAQDGPNQDLTKMAEGFAAKVMLSAQGNSGTILSFVFMEVAKHLVDNGRKANVSLEEFCSIFGAIGKKAMSCMPDAKVGTMISVVQESSEELFKAAKNVNNLGEMLDVWAKAAQESLQRTPDQLVVDGKYILRNAGVVDSGAKGYVLLIEGMQQALAGTLVYGEYFAQARDTKAMDQAIGGGDLHGDHSHGGDHGELKYRFCTECVVQLPAGTTSDVLNQQVSRYGDSVVPVVTALGASSSLGKVHIHSNDPAAVFAAMRELSTTRDANGQPILLKEKVDDMADQVQVTQQDCLVSRDFGCHQVSGYALLLCCGICHRDKQRDALRFDLCGNVRHTR